MSRTPSRIILSIAAIAVTSLTLLKADVIPTQTEIVKNGAKAYFKRLPVEGWERILDAVNLGDFELYRSVAKTGGGKNPFRMFNSTQHLRMPQAGNVLPFVNSGSDMQDVVQSEFGFCAGFTVVQRRLDMMLHFTAGNPDNEEVPSYSGNKEVWTAWARAKIDSAMALKMAIVPGFKNLREFAEVPEVTQYLKQTIVNQWRLTNVNVLQGVMQGMRGVKTAMTKDELKDLHAKLKDRLSLGVNPVVYLTKQNDDMFSKKQWIHVLQVVSITPRKANGMFSFQVWDINTNNPSRALREVVVSPDGKIGFFNGQMYQAGDDVEFGVTILARVIPLFWDEYEIGKMITNNVDFCEAHAGLCTKKAPEAK